MKGKQKSGAVAAILGKLLEAAHEAMPRPTPALRPIPVPVRRPAAPIRRD